MPKTAVVFFCDKDGAVPLLAWFERLPAKAQDTGVNYRILYFFHGKTAVVLTHGFSKQQAKVPPREIKTAVERKRLFQVSPRRHTYSE
jgi:phage-related protein